MKYSKFSIGGMVFSLIIALSGYLRYMGFYSDTSEALEWIAIGLLAFGICFLYERQRLEIVDKNERLKEINIRIDKLEEWNNDKWEEQSEKERNLK